MFFTYEGKLTGLGSIGNSKDPNIENDSFTIYNGSLRSPQSEERSLRTIKPGVKSLSSTSLSKERALQTSQPKECSEIIPKTVRVTNVTDPRGTINPVSTSQRKRKTRSQSLASSPFPYEPEPVYEPEPEPSPEFKLEPSLEPEPDPEHETESERYFRILKTLKYHCDFVENLKT